MTNPTPHLAFPFNLAVRAATNEQDFEDDVFTRVRLVLMTPIGSLDHLPDFGVPDQAFKKNGPDLTVIRAAILKWEPDAITTIESNPSRFDELVYELAVKVQQEAQTNG